LKVKVRKEREKDHRHFFGVNLERRGGGREGKGVESPGCKRKETRFRPSDYTGEGKGKKKEGLLSLGFS